MAEAKDSGFGFRIRPLGDGPQPARPPDPAPPTPPAQAQAPRPRAEPAQDTTKPQAPGDQTHTAARFPDAHSALAFLGTVAAAGISAEARARRGPAGAWWVEVPAQWRQAAALAETAGGRAYAGADGRWSAVPADGSAPAPLPPPLQSGAKADPDALSIHPLGALPADSERLPLADWPAAGLADLVVSSRLRPARPRRLDHVICIAPGTLARTILRRAVNLGFSVRLAAVEREPLLPERGRPAPVQLASPPPQSAAWLRIAWGEPAADDRPADQPRIPTAFLHALMRLPYTLVARPAGSAAPDPDGPDAPAPLLVDIRHAAPLSSALVAPLVPAGEHWLLGGPDAGHWRLRLSGRPVDAAELIAVAGPALRTGGRGFSRTRAVDLQGRPAEASTSGLLEAGTTIKVGADHGAGAPTAAIQPPPDAQPTNLQAPLPLRLVQRRGARRPPDAVLLDDRELDWLGTFLIGRPAAESAYLIPGPGLHLLLAPGGLLAGVPFGLPLSLLGPGGLYLQQGLAFSPPLPETARARAFPTGADDLIAVTADPGTGEPRAARFRVADCAPVWTLWAGPPPAVAAGAGGEAARRVLALAAQLRPPDAPKPKIRLPFMPRRQPARDRDAVLREALELERGGRLIEAAQRMEEIGEPAAAGRLYERAAERAG